MGGIIGVGGIIIGVGGVIIGAEAGDAGGVAGVIIGVGGVIPVPGSPGLGWALPRSAFCASWACFWAPAIVFTNVAPHPGQVAGPLGAPLPSCRPHREQVYVGVWLPGPVRPMPGVSNGRGGTSGWGEEIGGVPMGRRAPAAPPMPIGR